MNFGDCPYEDCSHVFCLYVPDRTPVFEKLDCPECNRVVWYRLSRVNPDAFTEEQFAERFEVNNETKIIKEKAANDFAKGG